MKRTCYNVLVLLTIILIPAVLYAQDLKRAEPYGGWKYLRDFIDQELIYPQYELENDQGGEVIIAFTVKPGGAVKDARCIKGAHPALNREAMRVFKKILWEPAVYRGQEVEDNQELSVSFNPKKYLKLCKERGYFFHEYQHEPVDTSGMVTFYNQIEVNPYPLYKDEKVQIRKFIADHLEYPPAAYNQNISGTVRLKYVIEPYGKISNIRVEKFLGAGCAEEAIRLIRLLDWSPGIHDGQAVRVMMSIDIIFTLPETRGY